MNLGFVKGVVIGCSVAGTWACLDFSPSAQDNQEPPVVAGGLHYDSDKCSIAGKIFEGYLGNGYGKEYAVIDLGHRYSRYEANIGIPDNWSEVEGTFKFQIDGETVVEGKVRKGERPVPLELDLTDAESMRIDIDRVCIAGSKIVKSGITDSTKVSLVSPGSGAKAKRGTILLTWKPIDKATAYGIQVTCTKLDEAHVAGSQRIWAFTTGQEPVFTLDAREFPTGEFRWSVIAFDEKRTLGVTSEFRRLVISK